MIINLISFVFGSRIKKLDSFIERRLFRFLIGRCIASIISKELKLNVYDTQCGCKVFSSQLASEIFQEKVNSTWLFDVEIFHRTKNLYGKSELIKISKEIPLQNWIDKDNSKVNFTYFFQLWIELYKIRKTYSKKVNANPKSILLS